MSLLNENLSGQMLLAMPGIGDPRFDRSVVYIFEHGPEGAMGFVVNQPAEDVTLNDILESLDLPISDNGDRMKAYLGGPVETGRGFVLHTSDYTASTTSLGNNHRIALTAHWRLWKSSASMAPQIDRSYFSAMLDGMQDNWMQNFMKTYGWHAKQI